MIVFGAIGKSNYIRIDQIKRVTNNVFDETTGKGWVQIDFIHGGHVLIDDMSYAEVVGEIEAVISRVDMP